ncbi:MAG: hypothetical protein CR988_07925 [Treponema sp.]|nr:MAG: hypothetical protein CR988_07925 [Treponema sp.]
MKKFFGIIICAAVFMLVSCGAIIDAITSAASGEPVADPTPITGLRNILVLDSSNKNIRFAFDPKKAAKTGSIVKTQTVYVSNTSSSGKLKLELFRLGTEITVMQNGSEISAYANSLYSISFGSEINIRVRKLTKSATSSTPAEYETVQYKLAFASMPSVTKKVTFHVVESMNGCEVKNPALTIKKKGSSSAISTTDGAGIITANLECGEYYSIYAPAHDGYATSIIYGYYVDPAKTSPSVTIVQKKFTGEGTADKIVFNGLQKGSTNLEPNATVAKNSVLNAKFTSTNGKISAVDNGGFGAAIGIDFVPSQVQGFLGQKINETSSSGWKTTYKFSLSKKKIPAGGKEAIIVAYDTTNNRCEARMFLNFEYDANGATLEKAKIKNFNVITNHYSHDLDLYSTPSKPDFSDVNIRAITSDSSSPSSYLTICSFEIKEGSTNRAILGFDILRSEDNGATFKKVSTVFYGGFSRGKKGVHVGIVNDATLSKNQKYIYKIEAYTDSFHMLKSNKFTTKLMPKFYCDLYDPAPNGILTKSDPPYPKFVFKISETALWNSSVSSYFIFDLLIVDRLGQPVWASKMLYDFSAGKFKHLPRGEKPKTVNYVATTGITVATSGTTKKITIGKDFFSDKNRNHVGKSPKEFNLITGNTYFWDIQDWGSSTSDPYDDAPAQFIWKTVDSTGNITGYAASSANSFYNPTAENGRAEFKVKSN